MTERPLADALLLAIDASTTACKAFVFDATGHIVSEGRAGIELHNPAPDAYEQDGEQWWQATVEALDSALAGLSSAERLRIVAACLTHQRETIVVTDAQGSPLSPAVVWMDARCREDVERASRAVGAVRLHALSGKPPCTTPSLYKLMYLMREHPDLTERAHIADVHAFLARRLVGRSVTSLASADPTGLVDMRHRSWASSLLDLIGVGSHQVPELVEPGAAIGPLLPTLARRWGLREDLAFYAGLGDGQAACLGAGVVKSGRAYLNLGTAVVSGVLTESYQIDQAFRTLFSANPRQYCLETDLKGGTFTIQWLLDKMLGSSSSPQTLEGLEERAAHVRPGSDGLVLVPYWCGVMNPYWNDDAAGAVLGWHGGHGPAHLYRAVLEGIALEQRLHFEGVEGATGQPIREIVVLGGGSRSRLWCQILADVLGRSIVRAETPEATALGAAVLAATSHRLYESQEAAAECMTRLGERFNPGERQSFYDSLYREVYRGLFRDIERRLTALTRLRRDSQASDGQASDSLASDGLASDGQASDSHGREDVS